MTGLLVSVRSAAEAAIALAAGVDLIDVKEPSRGSLGTADPSVWNEVLGVVQGQVPVSVALGELADYRCPIFDLGPPNYAKLGLAQAAAMSDWQTRWAATMQALPSGTMPVAVAYADWQLAGSPNPAKVLSVAQEVRAPFLLIDTFDKSRGNLLWHVSLAELAELSDRAALFNIRLALAGSLDIAAIRAVLPLAPAYVAVRGAACAGERTQAIDAARVKRLVELVRTSI